MTRCASASGCSSSSPRPGSCGTPWPAGSDGVVELAFAVLVALAGAAVAGIVAASLQRYQDLELRRGGSREAPIHHRTLDEAHPRRLGGTPE